MDIDFEKFQLEGYLGPFKLCDESKLKLLLRERYTPEQLYTWYKSKHEKSAPIVRTAADPVIVDILKPILGDDILLWGSHFIHQPPGKEHGWHLDVEHGGWDGITVWIGLKNLNDKTSVSLITHSHLLNTVPIELRKNANVDIYDDQAILAEAKKLDPRCELKTFHLNPGEFILWSGRAWHATSNESTKTRISMILQYCTPNNIPKIPLNYDYPDTQWSSTKPPCVLISGVDNYNFNKVLSRESIESSSEFLRKLRTNVFYNARYKAKRLLGAISRGAKKLI